MSGSATLLRLAWRSLWRQRRRTLLLILVVAYSTAAIIFFWAITDGFLGSIFSGQARLLQAPVTISTVEYFVDPDPENALPEFDDTHLGVPWSPRLEVSGLLRSPYGTTGVQLRGVDPEREPLVSDVPGEIRSGRMIAAPGELVLGSELARRLDVRIGERVAVDVSSVAGPQAAGLQLVGLVDSGVSLVDETTALIHLSDARSLSGVETATTLAVDAPLGREEQVAAALGPALPEGVNAYGVMAQMGELARTLANERLSLLPMGLLFSAFAAIAVTMSVVVSVMERTREFGVIIALGLDQFRLARVVVAEALLAALLGYVAGALLGYALIVWMARVNVLGPFFGGVYGDVLAGLAVSTDIRTDVRAEYLLYSGLTILLAGIFAALAPGRRVRNLEPAQAMRAA